MIVVPQSSLEIAQLREFSILSSMQKELSVYDSESPDQFQSWQNQAALRELEIPTRLFLKGGAKQTEWIVITGATSAGKTTLIRDLEMQMLPIVHEVARSWLEHQLREGLSLGEARGADHAFRMLVFHLTLETEMRNLQCWTNLQMFLDRGAADSITFHRASGYDPNEIVKELEPYRYRHVFILDPLDFEDDGRRTNNPQRRKFLNYQLEQDYLALGYDVVRVPPLRRPDRVQFILDAVRS